MPAADPDDPDDPYAAIAEWYDVEHDGFTADGEFYQAVIASPDGAHIHALEVGSGTGRLAAALGLAGWFVTGVEPSAAMRARCAARLAKLPPAVARRITVVAGTATALHLPTSLTSPTSPLTDSFDAAIIALGTFAHLTGAAERGEALAAIHLLLRPTGKLIIDLDLDGPRYLAEHPGERLRLGGWPLTSTSAAGPAAQRTPRRRLTHVATGAPGPTPGIVAIHHEYILTAGRQQISRTATTTTLALLTYKQVAEELRQAGYRLLATYGDYDLAPLAEGSPRALIVATP